MKFKTGELGNRFNGTSLQGHVLTSYDTLVELFGKPTYGPNDEDSDKTTCEWHIEFEDGTIATIYDWKMNETPMGIYNWHVGGKSHRAVWNVADVLNA